MTATTSAPLLKVGTFGVHVIKNPAGTYSYAGTVPVALGSGKGYATLADAEAVFINWYAGRDAAFRAEHDGNLRADIAARIG